MLFLVALGRAQMAPGDEHQECMEDRPPYASNIMMLMNSQHYSQLLGDGGVWDQIDFDDNNLDDNSQNPTSVSHNLQKNSFYVRHFLLFKFLRNNLCC